LSEELDETRIIFGESTSRFNRETKDLEAKVKAETEINTKLHEAFENLWNKCADFATRCANRLKGIFNSVGAASEEITPSAKDIPEAFDHIENEVEALDQVITGHRDFCALVASGSTAAAFMKASCTHAKTVNKPNFNLPFFLFTSKHFSLETKYLPFFYLIRSIFRIQRSVLSLNTDIFCLSC
jgi:hypothetical protein